MNNYRTFLCIPVFKNFKYCQDEIFNGNNLIVRTQETRSLVEALDGSITVSYTHLTLPTICSV